MAADDNISDFVSAETHLQAKTLLWEIVNEIGRKIFQMLKLRVWSWKHKVNKKSMMIFDNNCAI